MLSKLLLKAGILVGGFIIARIAARIVPERLQALRGGRRNGNGNLKNGSEVPNRHDVEEGDETRRSNRFRNTENHSEVPKPLLSHPTRLYEKHIFSFVESKKTLASSVQHNKGPSSSILLNPGTSHHKNDQTLTHQLQSSCKPLPSVEPYQPVTKSILSVSPSDPANPQSKTSYISAHEDGTLPIFAIPEDLKDLIQKDVVLQVLKNPVSTSTYKDYFDALLYAEDYYIEKWDGFEMKDMTLELHEAAIYKRKCKYDNWKANDEIDDKVFVAFEINSIPERRPLLLSRDFVSVRPSGKKVEPFQGHIYHGLKSNLVLVEFGEDFHNQHYSACKYNIKFSFNRVCLKRAHQAIAAASDPLFRNFLFPDSIPQNNLVAAQFEPINPKLDPDQISAVRQILSHKNPPPYLVEGPLSVNKSQQLTRTGLVVCEAVFQIYRTSPSCRILICARINSTCDVITKCLKEEISECDMFRANAAFRQLDEVPDDILPTCLYKRECFSCPSRQELRKFKVVVSTFMSSFRLHNQGIMAGHFSHIFLVDASSATEPETMVALANLANERTTVIITGAPRNHPGWIRSNIARQNGLMTSYFERLRESELYKSLDSKVITQLGDSGQKSDDTYSSLSYY